MTTLSEVAARAARYHQKAAEKGVTDYGRITVFTLAEVDCLLDEIARLEDVARAQYAEDGQP